MIKNTNNINFDKYKNMFLRVEKIEDTEFDDQHPNKVNTGYKMDDCAVNLKLSNQFCALFVYHGDKWFRTSEVRKQKECEGYDLLYTLNSVYKVTPKFVAIPGVQEKYSVALKTLENDGEEIN